LILVHLGLLQPAVALGNAAMKTEFAPSQQAALGKRQQAAAVQASCRLPGNPVAAF